MLESTMENEHEWFAGQIAANLAGGLYANERARFESHRRECPTCAALAGDAAETDGALMEMFNAIRPTAALEDLIIATLPATRRRRLAIPMPKINPIVARSAAAIAASLIIGGVGFVAAPMLSHGRLGATVTYQDIVDHTVNRFVSTPEQQRVYAQNAGNKSDYYNTLSEPTAASDSLRMKAASDPTFAVGADINADSVNGWLSNGDKDAQKFSVDGSNGNLVHSNGLFDPSAGAGGKSDVNFGLGVNSNGGIGLNGGNSYTGETQVNNGTPVTHGANGSITSIGGAAAPVTAGTYQYTAVNSAPIDANDQTSSFRNGGGAGGGGGRRGGGPAGAVAGVAGGSVDVNGRLGDTTAFFRPGDAASAVTETDDIATPMKIRRSTNLSWNGGTQLADTGSPGAPGIVTVNGGSISDSSGKLGPNSAATVDDRLHRADNLALSPAPLAAAQQSAPSAPAPSAPVSPPAPVAPEPGPRRFVIRSGEIQFEVDSFDSALVKITTIVGEEGGYVGTTDSQKMANGKVQGVITVRVPPEHLDTLILKLRALGDLKGQKIGAQDVTKQYTDLESELRAARAMEERLLDIIKTGKGEVKDLLEAEKELGTWREKIEQVTGEINYYNNLVSLSTLQITLTEKDISTAASATETETVNAGVEADDVAGVRAAVLKLIDDAKGHVRQSDLKQLEAGQYAAVVVAEVPIDASGPIVDRLRQLGRVARLDMNRQTVTNNGGPAVVNGAVTPGLFVQQSPTILNISIYNLANVAPRVTDNLNLACTDVETAYQAILDRVNKANGRVVTSNLSRPKPEQVTGVVSFEVRSGDAAAVLADVRGLGDVMRLAVTESADAANVTASKQGFIVQLFSWSSVAPRNVIEETIASTGPVADAFTAIQAAAGTAAARVIFASQNGGDQNRGASITLEVRRDAAEALERAVAGNGAVITRKATQSTDTENTIDSKVELRVSLVELASIPAAETQSRSLAVTDVGKSFGTILSAARSAAASVSVAQDDERNGQVPRATLQFEVLRSKAPAVEKAIADAGAVLSATSQRAPDESNTVDVKVKLDLTLYEAQRLPPRQTTQLVIETSDPESAAHDAEKAAAAAGARVVLSDATRTQDGTVERHRVLNIVEPGAAALLAAIRSSGSVVTESVTRNDQMPDTDMSRAQIDVKFTTEHPLVGADDGVWAATKSALATTIRGLLFSLQFLMIGLFLIGPWALAIWLVVWLYRRNRGKRPAVV
jgi:hypothetical protein